MVRSFPTDENPLIHPAISLSLLAAGMAAAIAMITTLCGDRKTPTASEASSPTAADNKPDENASPTVNPSGGETENDGDEQGVKELPLPPKMQQLGSASPPTQISKSASERKLTHMKSMNVNVPRSLSVARHNLDDGRHKKKDKIKGEDSIWTKTIILGEKCKVTDEEDGIIYEGKGKKISAYHPRAPSSMSASLSRQGSAIDAEALPSPEDK